MNLEDINASIRELEARLLIQEIERAGIEGASSMLHSTPASAKALRPPRQSDSSFTTMQSVGESAEKRTVTSNQGSASKQKSVHFANKTQRTPQGKPDSDDIRYALSKYLQKMIKVRLTPIQTLRYEENANVLKMSLLTKSQLSKSSLLHFMERHHGLIISLILKHVQNWETGMRKRRGSTFPSH